VNASVLLTVEDPHICPDLGKGEAPGSTLQRAIPAVGVGSLSDCLPHGLGEHAADGWIGEKLLVRFRPRQVKEALRSLNQPASGCGDLPRGLPQILPR